MGVFDGVELDELVLRGPRLTLRPWSEADVPAVLTAMQSLPDFQFLPDSLPPYGPADALALITDDAIGRAQGSAVGCAVVLTATGALVGSAQLRLPFERRQLAEIGYWVTPAAHGNGYAAEATDVLARWVLEHGLQRVQVVCDVRNIASAATALQAGFSYEGTRRAALHDPAGFHDAAVFARLATDSGEPVRRSFSPVRGPISDGVIALRPYDPNADTAANYELESDEVTLSVGFTGTLPNEAAFAARQQRWPLEWLVGSTAQFTIVDAASGRFAGTIQLRKVGPPGVAGVGYAVHPAFRGNGYTTRALRLLTEWAFANGYARLELGAKWHNVASRKAAAAAGFAQEGLLAGRLGNADGSHSDEAYYGLFNPAVERSSPPTP